ncbi:MAG: heme o synthase [Thermodesulfobacteriota bacterium]|nr:heme o synthase [Thermodesulfobacteriota bacterium]MEE2975035.1 heme o synthase [Thermodesulfobacteriota bacterium]|tara:strand:+ start:5297 stop:6175 length:879 start_codon:yes stop_codon:yes gene_type:complete
MKYLLALFSLCKPNIILSVGLTGFTGMILASKSLPDSELITFTLLSLIFSAAGSAIINNIIERKKDELMERLAKRVEALKMVGIKSASFFASLLITFSLGLSYFFVNTTNCILIVIAILSYTVYYTLFLKRSSPFGTVLGGIPGALPVIIGFSSIEPNISKNYIEVLVLFIFMMLWQPPHFWALAQHLADDYKKAGFPVMPLVYGQKYTNYLIAIYSLALLPISLYFWIIGVASSFYAFIAIIMGIGFLYTVFLSFKKKNHYILVFLFSIFYMLVINLSLAADILLSVSGSF